MSIWIRNGRLVDAASGTDMIGDLLIENGIISEMGGQLKPRDEETIVIEAAGKTVLPGLVDLHVHFRDPGYTYKEDIDSGSRAAACGGVTSMVAMPNTKPVIDSPEHYEMIREKLKLAPVHIYQAGAMTIGELGEEPADIPGMADAGIRVLSEDGRSVMNAGLCRKIFQLAAGNRLPVFDHCEDLSLRGDGCMNEDRNSRRLGLPGISHSVEDTITARDLLLAREAGARLHLCHMSTAGAVKMLRFAHQQGWHEMTGEVCPHHFILSSDDIPEDDGQYKMNPPLRNPEDVQELLRGLADGTIAAISTDHAPHAREEKEGSMKKAAFGIVGLETSLALSYTYLVLKGVLTLHQLVEKMCLNPARILRIDAGTLQPGHPGDVIVVDLDRRWRIDREKFASKGKNTPFHGMTVQGKVCTTICRGKVIWEETDFVFGSPSCRNLQNRPRKQ